jgi:hypothetical protein
MLKLTFLSLLLLLGLAFSECPMDNLIHGEIILPLQGKASLGDADSLENGAYAEKLDIGLRFYGDGSEVAEEICFFMVRNGDELPEFTYKLEYCPAGIGTLECTGGTSVLSSSVSLSDFGATSTLDWRCVPINNMELSPETAYMFTFTYLSGSTNEDNKADGLQLYGCSSETYGDFRLRHSTGQEAIDNAGLAVKVECEECTDRCSPPGVTSCSAIENNKKDTCGDFDEDPCYEWGSSGYGNCDSSSDCAPYLSGESCVYNRVCEADSCFCAGGSSDYCPPTGTVKSGICYYGDRECTADGCALQQCSPGTGQECDASQGCVSVCARANPGVTLSPSDVSAAPGETKSFTVTVKNNDNALCSEKSFSLISTVPGGWSSMLTPSSLPLAPGASKTATLEVSSPATAANGKYEVSLMATGDIYAGTGKANITISETCVHMEPTVGVSPSGRQGSPGESEYFTVTITNNDGTLCDESEFTLTVTAPSDWISSFIQRTVTVKPGESSSSELAVAPPSDAHPGSYFVLVKATSEVDPSIYSEDEVTFTIPPGGVTQPVEDLGLLKDALFVPADGVLVFSKDVKIEVSFPKATKKVSITGTELDGTQVSFNRESDTSFSYRASDLDEGSHHVSLKAYYTEDQSNYVSLSSSFTVRVEESRDFDPPSTTAVYPAEGDIVPEGGLEFRLHFDETLRDLEVKIDGVPRQFSSADGKRWTYEMSGLTEGEHTVEFTASDATGNIYHKTLTFEASAPQQQGEPPEEGLSGVSGLLLLIFTAIMLAFFIWLALYIAGDTHATELERIVEARLRELTARVKKGEEKKLLKEEPEQPVPKEMFEDEKKSLKNLSLDEAEEGPLHDDLDLD